MEYFYSKEICAVTVSLQSKALSVVLTLAVLLAASTAAQADLKQTAVVYAWAEENLKYQNSNIAVPFDGGWEPFLAQIGFDADPFDVSLYSSSCTAPNTTTQWAGTLQYGIASTDNAPMGAAGFQHTRNWLLAPCDRTGDLGFSNADLQLYPPNTYLDTQYRPGDDTIFQVLDKDVVTACTTGNCLEEIVTTMFVNLDTDCDGVLNVDVPVDSKGNLLMCFYVEAQTPGTGSPFWSGNIQARIAAGGGDKTVNLSATEVTAATISSFKAYTLKGRTALEWQTASETATAGFYLQRQVPETGEYVNVNSELLPGLLAAPQGGVYRYIDDKTQPGQAVTYRLIEMETGGMSIAHGPYTVTPSELTDWPADNAYEKKAHEIPKAKKARIAAAKAAKQKAKAHRRGLKSRAVKMAVHRDGIYFMSDKRIADILDMPAPAVRAWIGRGLVSLTSGGGQVAYYPADGNRGLYFFGRDIDSPFTKDNIYRLARGTGLVMETAGGKAPKPAGPDQTFISDLHLEQDLMGMPHIYDDPAADHWIWQYVMADYGSAQFPFTAAGAASEGTASLTVRLKGITDTDASPDHHAVVYVNGAMAGQSSWDGMAAHEFTVSFSQALLNGTNDMIEIKGIKGAQVPYSLFGIDSFDLTYYRRYEAAGDMLMAGAGGNAALTISGFSDPAIMVFDITEAAAPVAVAAAAVDASGGAYRVSFRSAAPDATYIAATAAAVAEPGDVWADQPSTLQDGRNTADYLIIAPYQLMNGAQALAEYRQSRGLEALVVDLEDIYDEFNNGIASPYAIKDFLSFARRSWAKAPRYIVLAGEGSFDYRNNLGHDDSMVPPIMMPTPFGMFAADNRYADVDGDDGIPEMAVGRLPVVNDNELLAVVDKIRSYETSSGAWAGRVLMVADNPDPAGDFTADSTDLAALLPDQYAAETIYLPEYSPAEARALLLAGINDGALIVNYIGHGGLDRLAAEGMLLAGDIPLLTNAGSLPVLVAMTCVAGQFSFPGFDSIGESLLLKDGGGMIAVWAPTGDSLNWAAKILDEAFFEAALVQGGKILGDVLLSALQKYGATDTAPVYMMDIYTLLGDPALQLR